MQKVLVDSPDFQFAKEETKAPSPLKRCIWNCECMGWEPRDVVSKASANVPKRNKERERMGSCRFTLTTEFTAQSLRPTFHMQGGGSASTEKQKPILMALWGVWSRFCGLVRDQDVQPVSSGFRSTLCLSQALRDWARSYVTEL